MRLEQDGYRAGYVVGGRAGDDVYAQEVRKYSAVGWICSTTLIFQSSWRSITRTRFGSATIWTMRRWSMCLIWTESSSRRHKSTAIAARLSRRLVSTNWRKNAEKAKSAGGKCNQARECGSQSGTGTGGSLGRAGTFRRKRHQGGVCGIAENGNRRRDCLV
ncbi:Uncharacterised protein [Neisseria mucosa]|nr:Uncharacterised protein [Neisseria mucosa]